MDKDKDNHQTVKRLITLFLAISALAIIVVLLDFYVLPFIYRIKEPFFVMPIEISGKADIPESWLIRNDSYGDGHFGAKRNGERKHAGIDFAAKMKKPVYASKSGWARALDMPGGYGKLVTINHPGGYETRYAHLSQYAIKKFQWVRQGDIIGFVGKTGNANFKKIVPHLHFEILYKGEPIDPEKELVRRD